MRWIRNMPDKFAQLSDLSIMSFKLGAGMMLCFYIVGFASLLSAPYVRNFSGAIALYYACLQSAPASLAAGVCAGLLGDMMLRFGGRK